MTKCLHPELRAVREALDWARSRRWSRKLQAGYDALDSLEEQYANMEQERALEWRGRREAEQREERLKEQLESAETTLAHAEEFIEHQGMSYRWAEWCEGRDPVKAAK